MVVNTRDLMNGLAVLTDDHNMRVTIKHSSKGALVCGAACFVGGVVLGPVGMAIGGTIGGLKAWHMSRGSFYFCITFLIILKQGLCVTIALCTVE